MINLEMAGENLLITTAYGDAAGLPVETWTAKQIRAKYGWLSQLVQVEQNSFFEGVHESGVWSDDTQLTLAVMDGLLSAGGFDLSSQAEALVRAYYLSDFIYRDDKKIPRGWGGSTVRSAERLISGVGPELSGEVGGSGNGVLMKLSPLIYWQAAKGVARDERHEQYDTLTTMTHNNDIARWTSRVHGDFLYYLLQSEPNTCHDSSELAESVLAIARYHERALGLSNNGSAALAYLRLPHLQGKPYEILKYTDGRGFYAPQTLAMAYGVFMHNLSTFTDTIFTAVNIGGDTDSIASIVGGMLNFYRKGDVVLPADTDTLYASERLVHLSKEFTKIALKGE